MLVSQPPSMEAATAAAIQTYTERHPLSRKAYEASLQSMPGGNTRTLLYTPPFPICMARGQGHMLYDEDGHEYCDMVGELTAGLYGHSNPPLQAALIQTIQDVGLSLGATNPFEQRYAALLCERFALDRIRFANSGTEANIHCLAAARKFTGRRKIVAFRGSYHGGVLSFSTGQAANNIDQPDFILTQFNDVAALEQVFADHGSDVAAVITEAMQTSGGFIRASPAFLDAVAQQAKKHGALFIMDEVVTSRLAPGGLKSVVGASPDLVTMGKYLGGGMPFGAFGGRQDVMAVYDPRLAGALVHSGTFQNNTLMLNAGYAGLAHVYTPAVVAAFNAKGDQLRLRLQACVQGTKFTITGRGSLMYFHATTTGIPADKITCKDDVAPIENMPLKQLFWLEMVNAGFWVQIRGSVALNLQLPDEALDSFVEAVHQFCTKHKSLVSL